MRDAEDLKLTVRKMHEVILRMLCDIDELCAENGILWFLSGGSCLGAVRHQGFIPWDDDADIMMPRPDYERFQELFKERFKGKYGIGSLETDDKWQGPYTRVWDLKTELRSQNLASKKIGVFVDLFPVDGLPDNPTKRKVYYYRLNILNGLKNSSIRTRFLENEKNRAIKSIAAIFTRPFGPRFFAERMRKLAKENKFEESAYVGASIACHYGDRETMKKEDMDKETRLLFEGHMFPVPVGYKNYLSSLYGDYMMIPEGAEEKGYSHLDHWEVKFME